MAVERGCKRVQSDAQPHVALFLFYLFPRWSFSFVTLYVCYYLRLCRLGEVNGDSSKYWEPSSNVVYKVDHVEMKVVEKTGDAPPTGPNEDKRAALQTAVTART